VKTEHILVHSRDIVTGLLIGSPRNCGTIPSRSSSLYRLQTDQWMWPLALRRADVKNEWNYTTIPPYSFMVCTETNCLYIEVIRTKLVKKLSEFMESEWA